MLATHPDRMLSATLGGAGVFREGVEMPRFVGELADSLEKGKGLGPLIVALTPPGKPRPTDEEIQQVSRLLVGDNSKALAAVLRGFKDLAVTEEQLNANRVPVLALIGEKDPLKKSVDDLKDRLANLQVVVISGADHITAFTNRTFLEALIKFLDEHGRKEKKKSGER
jgi:pimeloyl-ACP methyl ester carboxylesterase